MKKIRKIWKKSKCLATLRISVNFHGTQNVFKQKNSGPNWQRSLVYRSQRFLRFCWMRQKSTPQHMLRSTSRIYISQRFLEIIYKSTYNAFFNPLSIRVALVGASFGQIHGFNFIFSNSHFLRIWTKMKFNEYTASLVL